MKTIFFGHDIHGTHYKVLKESARVAKHFNPPDDIVVLSTDANCTVPGFMLVKPEWMTYPAHAEALLKAGAWCLCALRWLATDWYCRTYGISGPIYCPDWEVLHFANLEEAIKPFAEYDVVRGMFPGQCPSAAHVFGSPAWLERFCQFQFSKLGVNPSTLDPVWHNDMILCSQWVEESDPKPKQGDMSREVNGAVFDTNPYFGDPYYEMEDAPEFVGLTRTKRIVWKDNLPHFVRQDTKALVKVIALHCWGSFKARIHEFAVMALGS